MSPKIRALTASNCAGAYETSPRRTMAAFDLLPTRARRALANSYFNWATQPIREGLNRKSRIYKSDAQIEATIRRFDEEKLREDGSIQMEYAVMAETHDGELLQIRRGFSTASEAESHPIKLSQWKKVWVAPIDVPAEIKKPAFQGPRLPPKPWDWVASSRSDKSGQFHAYLVDATGKKIGAIWGGVSKALIADHILTRVND